jgi:hypothetical protein
MQYLPNGVGDEKIIQQGEIETKIDREISKLKFYYIYKPKEVCV